MDQPSRPGGQVTPEELERWRPTMESINGSPYYRLLGMRVESMGGGYARLVMPVEEKLLQIYQTVHGGATASLADSAVAVALISTSSDDEKAFTVELKLNFLAAVTHGSLTAEAWLVHRGKSIAVGDIEIRNGDGRLVAKGIATYMPVKG